MGKKIDMTGWDMSERVEGSQIIVIKEAQRPTTVKSKSAHTYWECKCKLCGNIFVTNGSSIRRGITKSCGCKKLEHLNFKDLTGQQFGRLTVLKLVPERDANRRCQWLCQCNCGNQTIVSSSLLLDGRTKSCGCKKLEHISKLKFKDLTGQHFGYLTALKLVPERSADSCCQWLCKCSCGNQTVVSSNNLLSGNTVSCGCIKSIGEQRINRILTDANIPFLHNKGYFHDLVSDKGAVLRYDFIIFQDNKPIRIIEFDGTQHYEYRENGFFSSRDEYERQQYLDALKNEYARAHNIPLVRIPYKERDNLTLELLLGNKYLVT